MRTLAVGKSSQSLKGLACLLRADSKPKKLWLLEMLGQVGKMYAYKSHLCSMHATVLKRLNSIICGHLSGSREQMV